MSKKDISYLVLSDIHFGHKKNTTEEIINNLNVYFGFDVNNFKFPNIDIVFLAGDIFDSALDYFDPDIAKITHWFNSLMYACENHKIKLRILEGTRSHDWKQSKNLIPIAKLHKELDFKYIEVLSIEKIQDLNLSVLYVPDEWSTDSNDTFEQIEQLLLEQNMQQVDIAIMHGLFDYQETWKH